MTMGPSSYATATKGACANCGRALASESLHPAVGVTSRSAGLCDDCWFDAEKE